MRKKSRTEREERRDVMFRLWVPGSRIQSWIPVQTGAKRSQESQLFPKERKAVNVR